MPQEIRFATFNVCNLAPPGMVFYDNMPVYSDDEYAVKVDWIAKQLDVLDADVIGFQEIFSQASLKDVLAKTEKYRNAQHIGFDPDPTLPFTPSVALVSRLPLAAPPASIGALPPELIAKLPLLDLPLTRFTRPLLHVPVIAPSGQTLQVVVTHLKSKRPDFHAGENEQDPAAFGLASLRSLYRRGVEALGLHEVICRLMDEPGAPLVVMGDFNDVADAVTTQLVMGTGRADQEELGVRLFDCRQIQAQRGGSREFGYTHMHDGCFNTIDHVLVSRHFHQAYPDAIGEVAEVVYLNDHVLWRPPGASDHGLALVRMRLFDKGDS